MKREEVDGLIADLMAEHFERLRTVLDSEIDRMVARKPVPPFVPPPAWAEGKRHAAGLCVRHRGGIFYAQRDTDEEPPSDAWLPLVVGIAGIDVRWSDSDRAFICRAQLSDGAIVDHKAEIAVPIVRGYWNAETTYYPGDRVFRFGEHHCLKMSLGVDPTADDAAEHWEKVGGKYASMPTFKIDDDGTWSQGGRDIGSMKPMVRTLLIELMAKKQAA